MSDFTQGVLQSVTATYFGDALAASAAPGDTVLQVNDAEDFAEDGGEIAVNGFPREYDAADHEAGTITLSAPLPAAADAEDPIDIFTATGTAAVEWTAEVTTPGGDETITVNIPSGLVGYFREGDEQEGELVALEPDPSEPGNYRIASQPGQPPSFDGAAVWNPYLSRRATTEAVPNSTWTVLTGWTETMMQGVTVEPDGSVTIDYPGFYVIDASPTFATNSTSSRGAQIKVNGVRVGYLYIPADPSGSTDVPVSARRVLQGGDNVTVEVSQTSGATLNIISSAGISPFSLYRVSI